MVSEGQKRIRVLNPEVVVKVAELEYAPRPQDLGRKRVGFLDNGKFNVCNLYDQIEELLQQRLNLSGVIRRIKSNVAGPAEPQILDELASTCDVVISGVGD